VERCGYGSDKIVRSGSATQVLGVYVAQSIGKPIGINPFSWPIVSAAGLRETNSSALMIHLSTIRPLDTSTQAQFTHRPPLGLANKRFSDAVGGPGC
jgi:hypothetical protein